MKRFRVRKEMAKMARIKTVSSISSSIMKWSVIEIPCRINNGVVLTHSSSTNKIEK